MDVRGKKRELDRLLEDYIKNLTEKTQTISPQNTTQKHHYVPRFYLEQFINLKNNKITVVDKLSGKKFEQTAVSTGFERDFYIVGERKEGDWHVMVENLWSLIESDVAPVYRKMLQRKPLDLMERVVFSMFVSTMICRSRTSIRISQEMVGGMIEEQVKYIAKSQEKFDKVFGDIPDPPSVLGNSAREAFLENKVKVMGNQNFSSPAAPYTAISLSPYILNMAWKICNPARQLVTSDTPAIAFSSRSLSLEDGKVGGVALKDSCVAFPLAPDVLFMGNWEEHDYQVGHVCLSKKQTRDINNMIVSMADRFLYLAVPDSGTVRFIMNRRNRKVVQRIKSLDTADGQILVSGQFIENFEK